jgi:TMEM175 potassium channel family protein
VSKGRLEAFSDGVIAVAITLLVLNLVVPEPGKDPHGLGHALAQMWPSYLAYVTSFLTIGIIWINHHAMIARLREPDHMILSLNLLLLLTIGVLPFATNLMATYLRETQGEVLAAAVYGGAFLLMALAFAALHVHTLYAKPHLLAVEMSDERRRQIITRNLFGIIPYMIATALAVVSPYLTIGICFALAGYYALPLASGGGESV